MERRRTAVKVRCPGCDAPVDTWVYDPFLHAPRGGGRGRSADSAADGEPAKWVRYRCRAKACRLETVWPTRQIALAHYRQLRRGKRDVRWSDLDIWWQDEATDEILGPVDWREWV